MKPMHEQFVQPSKQYADIIIDGSKDIQISVGMLISFFNSL